MIGLRVSQGRTAFLDLLKDADTLERGLKAELAAIARAARADLVTELRAPKHGRVYKVGADRILRKGKTRARKRLAARASYQASAPGEPPASFTGNLLGAVRAVQRRGGFSRVVFIHAGSSLGRLGAHRHLLEFGTGPRYLKSGKYVGRVAPRPFILPVVAKYEAAAPARLEAAVDAAIAQINR